VQIHKIQNFVQVIFRPIMRSDKIMSYENTLISVLQVEFFRQYSSLIGCMSSVKTRLDSVGVSQVCSPYSTH